MASSIEDAQKQIQQQIINIAPKKIKKPFEDALVNKKLDIGYRRVTNEELIQFVVPFLNATPNIKVLNVSGNQIVAAGAAALAANATLTTLDVSDNQIGTAGAAALAANATLTTLNVSYNQIGTAGNNVLGKLTKIRRENFIRQKLAFLGVMGTNGIDKALASASASASASNAEPTNHFLNQYCYIGINNAGNRLTKNFLVKITDFNKPKACKVTI